MLLAVVLQLHITVLRALVMIMLYSKLKKFPRMVKVMETLPIQEIYTFLLKSTLLKKVKATQMVPLLLSLQMVALKLISTLQVSNQELPILQLIRHLVTQDLAIVEVKAAKAAAKL